MINKLDEDGFHILLELGINFKTKNVITKRKNGYTSVGIYYIYQYTSHVSYFGQEIGIYTKYGISHKKWDNRIKASEKQKVIWNWLKRSKINLLVTTETEEPMTFKLDFKN